MVSIFQPEKSKKMHNLPPFGKFFIKKPGDKKTIQNPEKGGFFT